MALILIVLYRHTEGHATEDDFLRLYNNLTTSYSRHLRPVVNQSAPVLIDVSFMLFSILGVKDTESEIDFIPLFQATWQDHNLKWNPNDFGGIDQLSLTESTIWAPKLALHPSKVADGTLWNMPTSHFVTSDGQVTFSNAGFISQFCELDMTYFPYDYQQCELFIKILDATVNEIDFRNHYAMLSTGFIQNKEWLVTNISSSVYSFGYPLRMSIVRIVLSLQRRPTFCSLNITVPAIMVSILCMLTFFVPVESGERLSYALTTLLSLAVYITYIGGLIPRASNPIPILLEYLVFLFVISTVCVVLSLFVIKLRWTPVRISPENRKYVCIFGCRLYLYKRPWTNKVDVNDLLFNGNSTNECNKNVLVTDISGNVKANKKDTIADLIANDYNFGNDVNKTAIQVEAEIKAGREFEAMKLPFSMIGEQKPSTEEKDDVEPGLLYLCNLVDISSFCLSFLTFSIMTIYTLIRFFSQEEPQIGSL